MGLFNHKDIENANLTENEGAGETTSASDKMTATKQTLVNDLIDYDIEIARFFFDIGMYCVGCPASYGESIEDACAVHGVDADELVEKINEYLAAKGADN